MTKVKIEDLPDYFFVKCDGPGHSGAIYGEILPHDKHSLGYRNVTFGVFGYKVKDGETVEIHKKRGLLGVKLILLEQINTNKWKYHKISVFDVKPVS